jgi:hypothetical protein
MLFGTALAVTAALQAWSSLTDTPQAELARAQLR